MVSGAAIATGVVVVALAGCPGGMNRVIKTGLDVASDQGQTVKRIPVQDPDTQQSKLVTYVKRGGKWTYEGCKLVQDFPVQNRTCLRPQGLDTSIETP